MKFDVYCDESRPDLLSSSNPRARFMVIGSLWLPRETRGALKSAIHELGFYKFYDQLLHHWILDFNEYCSSSISRATAAETACMCASAASATRNCPP